MSRLKVTYIISNVNKSLAFEWIAHGLKDKYDLSFILLNNGNSDLESFLRNEQVQVKRIRYRGKIDFISSFIRVIYYFLSKRPDVVHAHLLDAQLIGLTAAWITRISKRIYTRHNSTFHHDYHRSGVKYDLWSNYCATNIISISQATDKTLIELERVSPLKIVKIPHGFDLQIFENVSEAQIQRVISRWKIAGDPVIGVISRHIEWKGLQFIIPAFRKFLSDYPSATLVLANALGPYHQQVVEQLKAVSPDRVVLIPFESDGPALYKSFDIYVHTPIDPFCEAFGQTYVEALASGVPSIFTLSGIAKEFIENGNNALTVDFRNSDEIYVSLLEIWRNPELRQRLSANGKHSVTSRFKLESMLSALSKIYG